MTPEPINTRIVVQDPRVRDQIYKIVQETDGYHILPREAGETTDLLIYSLGNDPQHSLEKVHSLVEQGKVKTVFLTCATCEAPVLLKAIRAGAREFFPQPLKEAEIETALIKYRQSLKNTKQSQPANPGRIFGVMGSKGGVGATTLAANLATGIAACDDGSTVAVIDMNMLFGELPLFFDLQPQHHLGEVVRNIDRLDETFLKSCLARHSSGVNVLPSSHETNNQNAPSPEMMDRILGMMQNVFDYVIIDVGKNLDDTTVKLLQMSETIFLVTVLSLPALSNTKKLVNFLLGWNIANQHRVKVVVNQYTKKNQISLSDAEKALSSEVFWTLPKDAKTTESAIHQGSEFAKVAPRAKITRSLAAMADTVVSPNGHPPKKKWRKFV